MYKVLIAEDEEFILHGIKNIIDWESLGLEVTHLAEDGLMAYEQWKEMSVDIVITDINMPKMNGLNLLEKLRGEDERVRFLILSGYEEFDYAKKAIRLDVEDYILKPIDEDKLEEVLKAAARKLIKFDKEESVRQTENNNIMFLLEEHTDRRKAEKYLRDIRRQLRYSNYYVVNIKIYVDNQEGNMMTELITLIQTEFFGDDIYILINRMDEIIFLCASAASHMDKLLGQLQGIQIDAEHSRGIQTFITLSPYFSDLEELRAAYKETVKLQNYRMIFGYGSCINKSLLENRNTKDIAIDTEFLHKMILQKDREGTIRYMEELFVNNIEKDTATPESVLQLTMETAMFLQKLKEEYNLNKKENSSNLFDMMDTFYHADNLYCIKSMFVSEVSEIIEYLHTKDSCYTPVVRQIMAEVRNNYKEDMNLKTLAYKYNMNTSYLGQIFQREVGCTFAKYLCNIKNSIAKDLILNTNMRIHDIAKEVGYTDTSYFYRKFKSSYGVSPASLREIKRY